MAFLAPIISLIGTVWGIVKPILTAAYIISLWTQSSQQDQSPTYSLNLQTQCSNELSIPIIYGRVKAAGNIVWQEVSDDKTTVNMFVAFGEGEIDGFEDVRINDIEIGSLPECTYTAYNGTKTQSLDERCWKIWVPPVYEKVFVKGNEQTRTGDHYEDRLVTPGHYTGTAEDGYLITGSMKNIAYLALTIKASDQINGGAINVTAIVKGRKVRVWDEDWAIKYSENPAWCLADLLTNFRYGGGYSDARIDMESFKEVAEFCDELVDGEPRFQMGFIIDWQASLIDVTNQIRLSCRSFIASHNGKLALKIEKPEEPVQHFTMDQILPDSLQISVPGKDEILDLVQVTYTEPSQNWAKIPAQSFDESNPVYPNKKELSILAITRFSQASRLAYFYRVYSKYCKLSGKFKTTICALNRTPGDVITITDNVMGWVEKPVRILEIRHAPDQTHEIYFREYNETIYGDVLGSAIPTLNYSELSNPFGFPANPTGLIVTESTFIQKSGELVSEIYGSFYPAISTPGYAYSIIEISSISGIWESVGTVTDIGNFLIHNLIIGVTYTIRVRTVSIYGFYSSGIITQIVITGKDTLPSDVPKLIVSQNGAKLKAVITLVNDPDVNKYELRLGSTWENSIKAVPDFPGPTIEFEATQEGTLTFLCKAVDRSNGKSTNAAKCIVEVYNIPPKNYIIIQNQDLSAWTSTDMYRDPWGRWQIQSIETIDMYGDFFDMFENTSITLKPNPQLILPVIDLGPKVLQPDCYYIDPWGTLHLLSIETIDTYDDFFDIFEDPKLTRVSASYIMTTFLGVTLEYNQNANNRIDTYYRTRVDGDQWSIWKSASEKQFTGKRIEIKLNPFSLDRVTNVNIAGAVVEVDVPDVTERQVNIDVPTGGAHITYKQKYFDPPIIEKLVTRNMDGVMITNQISNASETGCDVFVLDGTGVSTTGKIHVIEVRGY